MLLEDKNAILCGDAVARAFASEGTGVARFAGW
jgi:hypothetical protein